MMKNLILMAAAASLLACTTTTTAPEDDGSGGSSGTGGKGNPPPSGEPVVCDIALDGDVCAEDGGSCSFSDGSIDCFKQCIDGRWSEACYPTQCDTTECPSEAPAEGESCNPNCVYECGYADVDTGACGVTEVIARCMGDGGWWSSAVCPDSGMPPADCLCELP